MEEKRTKENNREKGGLNDGNPNTDSTPIDPVRLPNVNISTNQHNYEDEKKGWVPDMQDNQGKNEK
jgi:hypothetical protein